MITRMIGLVDRGTLRGFGIGLAAFAGLGLGAEPAWADETATNAAQCVAQHVKVQELRKSQRLIEARAALKECTRPECPALVQRDCAGWIEELEKETPSVIFQVTSEGAQVADARVLVDGAPVQLSSGTPIRLDPGQHKFLVEHAGYKPSGRDFVVFLGQRFMEIKVALEPLPKPKSAAAEVRAPAMETYRPVMPATYVLGAVTLLGTASFVTWGLLGQSTERELERTCKTKCTDDDLKPVRMRYLAADISLGIAAASAVATVLTIVLRPKRERPVTAAVLPSPNGLFGTVSISGM